MTYKGIDLFCGIGGFRIAMNENNVECVFSSDNDKFAKRTGDRSLSRKIINRSSLIHNRKQCQDEDAYNPARESIMS